MDKLRYPLKEPLLHFAVIGLLLLGVSRILSEPQEDPNVIRIDAPTQAELAQIFEAERERLPTEAEMDRLVRVHILNEALYREAKNLELDHGDQMLRERMVQRMRLMMNSGIVVQPPTDTELRAWYEERKEDYAIPALISFVVIGLDTDSQSEAMELARSANAADAVGTRFSQSGAPLARFENRPREQMVELLNEAFVASVEQLTEDEWTPVPSPQGWQVVKYLGSTDQVMRDFETVRAAMHGDWTEAERNKEEDRVMRALLARYPVETYPYESSLISESSTSAQSDLQDDGIEQ
ncbi:MAG: peptidylprolyl isomerase [Pseudomonadota bacterium]